MSDEFDPERFPGNFYRGMIMRLDRVRGRGAVRSHQGREVPFEFPFVEIAGAAHSAHQKCPDTVKGVIGDFLAEVDLERAGSHGAVN